MKHYKTVKENDAWYVVNEANNKVVSIFLNDAYEDAKQAAMDEATRLNVAEADKKYVQYYDKIQDAINATMELKRWLSNLKYRMEVGDVYDHQVSRQRNNVSDAMKTLQTVVAKIPSGPELEKERDNHFELVAGEEE